VLKSAEETGSVSLLAILCTIIGLAAFSHLKVVPDGQRFAVFRLGRFVGLKGPGLVFLSPMVDTWRAVKTGDRGKLLESGRAQFASGDLEVQVDGIPHAGAFVRVIGFQEGTVLVAPDRDQKDVVICSKCGHANTVS
jgi:hypothetical protein